MCQSSGSEQSPDGDSTIICGDALSVLADLADQDPCSVHLVATDPPYFLDGLDSAWRKGRIGGARGTGSVGGLPPGMKFDRRQGVRLQSFIEETGHLLFQVLKPGGFAIVFSQPRLSYRVAMGLDEAGFEVRDIMAWHFTRRAQAKAFSLNHFIDRMPINQERKDDLKRKLIGLKTPQLRPQWEAMILAQKPRAGTHLENWLQHETSLIDSRVSLDGTTAPSNLMTVEKPNKDRFNGHLTVKPVQLMEHLIKLFSAPGQVVLDPFLGSGTTAIAAKRSGRRYIGIEINQEYVRIAKMRLKEEVEG